MCVFTQVLASGGDYWITYWYSAALLLSLSLFYYISNIIYRVNLEELVFRNTSSINDKLISIDNNSTTTSTASGITNQLLWWTISRQTCIIVFAVLTFSMILATLVRSATFVSVCMRASMNLHNKMFNAITRATMYFFNTNSSGKNYLNYCILIRFT